MQAETRPTPAARPRRTAGATTSNRRRRWVRLSVLVTLIEPSGRLLRIDRTASTLRVVVDMPRAAAVLLGGWALVALARQPWAGEALRFLRTWAGL